MTAAILTLFLATFAATFISSLFWRGVSARQLRNFQGKLMSALSDLQDASVANTAAIDALAARVAALPQSAATEAELAAVTAELTAAKAKLDTIAA